MCPKKGGVNIRVELDSARNRLYAERHFCQPADSVEGHALAMQLLWGLCSAVFQAVNEEEVFDLRVSVTGLRFLDSPQAALLAFQSEHPLHSFADVLTWRPLPGHPGKE